ncbi:MAG: glucosamine-6-phosphate deaminase [Microbacteriaceae bacterium]|nr:glucosamine-6-phosphate deaminase [Microbacteriaceae bacterium]
MAEVVILPQEQLVELATAQILDRLHQNPEMVLGVATGSTPMPIYERLATSGADFSRARAFALDEYVGLPESHPQSYHHVVDSSVTKPLGFKPQNVHVPNGNPETIIHAGADFEAKIAAVGGIDIQILGLGTNGHIGFNEPGSSLSSRTRVKVLTEKTRMDNSRFFDSIDEVPGHCITQGIGTILESKQLLLLAFGKKKAKIAHAMLEGPVTASVPASAIQLHRHVSVLLDEDAASELENANYYRYVWEHKLGGQALG